MIEKLFIQVLNMSMTGSIVILAVLLMRILLKKAPKIFCYCLWAAVLFRLFCPVSFTAFFSPFSVFHTSAVSTGRLEYIPQEMMVHVQPEDSSSVFEESGEAGSVQSDSVRKERKASGTLHTNGAVKTASAIWLLGIGVLITWNFIKVWKLNRSLKNASWEKENIYKMEGIATPFVMGIFGPKIYLPYHLEENEQEYILLHEQIHIKRKDHLIKLVSCMALYLHWFNPLVWAAFFLSGKDMEMSCDEAVLRRMGRDVKKDYSSSLLSMAVGKAAMKDVPLAFGEGDTGSRIKNVLRYQKPTAFAVRGAAALCAAGIVLLSANPSVDAKKENDGTSSILEKGSFQSQRKDGQQKFESIQGEGFSNSDGERAESSASGSSAQSNNYLADRFVNVDGQAQFPNVSGQTDQAFYDVSIRTISRSERTVDTYVQPLDFPFEEGEPLSFSDDCRFVINVSMDGVDYKEVTFDQFASYIEHGGDYLNRPCLLGFKDGQIVYAVLKSVWFHYGITPLRGISEYNPYDEIAESDGRDAFYEKYSLVSSETMDISDSEGSETIEVYRDQKGDGDTGIVLFKNADGQVLSSQDVHTARAGWNNIYLGSIGKTSFILIVHIEDRWNYGGYSYEVYRLDEEGRPLLMASSEFEFHLSGGSSLIYDDEVFQTWAASMERYLKNSHLILSSQDGEIRTEKVSEITKYNYDTLSLKERAVTFSEDDSGMICFQGSWYGTNSLRKETVEWIMWYNSLQEEDQLKISSIAPELIDAKYMVNADTQDAASSQ